MLEYKNQVNEKLAKSLTAETTDLLPFLPYLLQDLWELGSEPDDIVTLIKKNIPIASNNVILDLACGKGAVCVKVAKALDITMKGIDIIPEFIDFAKQKAIEHEVQSLCEFVVEDINQTTSIKGDYDGVILGAVGNVLGSPEITLDKLKNTIKENGFIIIADAYLKPDDDLHIKYPSNEYYTYQQWINMFEKTGLTLIDRIIDTENSDLNDFNTTAIIKRAEELIETYPMHKELFEGYIKSQELECEDLENILVGITWLLRK
jgi:cyclopropane fatty-acyl-phospholipid synthase-like methyltransferase